MSPRLASPVTPSTVYLTSRQIRERFGGRGPLWIQRQIESRGFPKPFRLAGGRLLYWKKSEVEDWERGNAERAA